MERRGATRRRLQGRRDGRGVRTRNQRSAGGRRRGEREGGGKGGGGELPLMVSTRISWIFMLLLVDGASNWRGQAREDKVT
eukprot:765152-Hanusia_phi.AAC.3